MKPILCLDFDGVIHSYVSGWQGATVIPDEPVDGSFDFIERASDLFRIAIFSSRSCQPGGVEAMKKWFEKWGFHNFNHLSFPKEKPPAFLTIDDRAITFKGVFPNPKKLLNFKTWQGR